MPSALRWAVVCLLSLGMIIAYVDRANISVALALPAFRKLFQLTDSQRGALNSAFFWSYAFLQIPAGYVVDRYGVKWPYAISFVLWSLFSAATAFATTVGQIVVLRLLLGIGEAIVTPASMRWIRFNVPESQRGLAVGIYMAGTKYGPGIGIPIAAFLSRDYGWQNMFLILGLGGMVWLIPWILMVRNDDRALASAAAASDTGPALPFAEVFKTPLIYGVIVGTFCYNYFVFFSMTWLPAYLVEQRGMTPEQMGIIASASFSGMGTAAIVAGLVADRLIARGWDAVKVRKGFTLAGLGLASTELIGALSSDTNVAMIFAVISLTGLGLATANYWALTQTLIPGGALAGRIAGVQNFASNGSGIVAPLLTGWLKETTGTYEVPMAFIFGLLLLGIGAYVFLVRERYVPRLVTS